MKKKNYATNLYYRHVSTSESLARKDSNTQIFSTRISVNSSLNRRCYLVYSSFSLPSQTSP